MLFAERVRKYLGDIGWPVIVWLLLLLLRPLIDATWFLKETDVGVSPLQLLGAGLPAFFVWSIWKRRHALSSVLLDWWEIISWGVLLLVAATAVVVISPGQETMGLALKLVLPPLAIFFGVLYLREARARASAAIVLALAGVVPLLFLSYELIAGPMATSLRNEVQRYIGPYAQVSVYGLHLSLMLMGVGYLAIIYRSRWSYISLFLLVALLAFSAAFLVHVSTWAVWLGLMGLIVLLFLLRGAWKPAVMLVGIAALFTIFGFTLRTEQPFQPVLMTDVQVLTNDAPPEWFANSRGLIWSNYLSDYLRLPLHAQIFGSSLSGRNDLGAMGFGAHNDFLRILMATGAAGLLLYLFWLARTTRAVLRSGGESRYLGLAALIILLGYSVALTPTFIMPLVTALLPVLGSLVTSGSHSALRYARPADAGRATQGDGLIRSAGAVRAARGDGGFERGANG